MDADPRQAPPNARSLGEADARSRRQGALAYLFGAFSGVVLLVLRREDRFVQFHSLQSIAATVVALALGALLWLFSFFPILGFLYGMALGIYKFLLLVLWLYLLASAYRGHRTRLPFLGSWAERQLV